MDYLFGQEGDDLIDCTGCTAYTHVDGDIGYDTLRSDSQLSGIVGIENIWSRILRR